MFRSRRSGVIVIVTILLGITGLFSQLVGAAAPPAEKIARLELTADGKLKQPVDFSQSMYVGTPVTSNDLNGCAASFPEFHAIYMGAKSFAHYEKTGKFRDGTVLIKEFSSVGSREAANGKGNFQGDFTCLEAAIKDSERCKDDPDHWAHFSFVHEYPLKAEASKDAASACNQCQGFAEEPP